MPRNAVSSVFFAFAPAPSWSFTSLSISSPNACASTVGIPSFSRNSFCKSVALVIFAESNLSNSTALTGCCLSFLIR